MQSIRWWKISGELGIEGYYDDILSGTNGYTKYLKYTSSNYKIPNTNEDTKKLKMVLIYI